MYLIYSFLTLVFFIIVSPYFAYQALRYRKYIGSLRQRLGYLPVSFNLDGEPSIWIHAVSVGEVLAARALLPELRECYPSLRLFMSTTTMTGQRLARQNLQGLDGVFYFPFDLSFIVNRTLRLVRPKLFIMMETEIWPNLLRACRRQGVKTMLVNGRISARSFPRYRAIRPLFRHVLEQIDRYCAQGNESAQRLIDLGADPARVIVTGSLKFDSLEPPTARPALQSRDRVLRYFRMSERRHVVVAASTLKGEEAPVLRAFARVKRSAADALLIIAPRHPQRFDDVVRLVESTGFSVARRTDLPIDSEPRMDVVVLDTIGELARLYQVATVVFVGGSLVDAGGHNILEPAVFGKPIVFGPQMQNFQEIAEAFVASNAACQVRSEREFEEALMALLADPARRAGLGAAARALVESNRGAKQRSLSAIQDLLPPEDSDSTPTVRPFRLVQ
ncbi:MAG TPA: 3-deoxy-D-manno-octulosonic acid transferase [Acidobacteria bacterium]|jgi:3-deoxy-D-manno-octulosonic-acid transferase|nr:3-deoxy-D-manno-octulosonic acid transferase [Acidobacteriota bacterium]MDP6371654.1 3-deoxy-D-manno-octulosonic acid transferase [Vicinamibacterales bacterium]HAK54656.1 3-deoxy-D-manno-octulosonic acid transferase [Acidobacteriota bacterium]|tara:strand:+ start:19362 stop:20702 length:1341 start_codon:yes stop_codon:yes gene_type:complete